MINRYDISAAARVYAKERWSNKDDQCISMDGFEEGVRWAQEELLKSLWHSARKKPKKHVSVLVEMQHGSSSLYILDRNHGDWEVSVENCRYIKWCYLDDILPKEGGER